MPQAWPPDLAAVMRIHPDTFTDGARTIMFHADAHATRLGHSHRGGEHFLLALAAADLPVAAVLRERGVTPERVEEGIVRLEGPSPAAALLAGLDTGALAATGVDLGAVRDRMEVSFGPDALAGPARPPPGSLAARWASPGPIPAQGVPAPSTAGMAGAMPGT